jgi:hypothetical protein
VRDARVTLHLPAELSHVTRAAPFVLQCPNSMTDLPLGPNLVSNGFSNGSAPWSWECFLCRGNSTKLRVPRNKRYAVTPPRALLNSSSGVAVNVYNLQPGWTHQILAWVSATAQGHGLKIAGVLRPP